MKFFASCSKSVSIWPTALLERGRNRKRKRPGGPRRTTIALFAIKCGHDVTVLGAVCTACFSLHSVNVWRCRMTSRDTCQQTPYCSLQHEPSPPPSTPPLFFKRTATVCSYWTTADVSTMMIREEGVMLFRDYLCCRIFPFPPVKVRWLTVVKV